MLRRFGHAGEGGASKRGGMDVNGFDLCLVKEELRDVSTGGRERER